MVFTRKTERAVEGVCVYVWSARMRVCVCALVRVPCDSTPTQPCSIPQNCAGNRLVVDTRAPPLVQFDENSEVWLQ